MSSRKPSRQFCLGDDRKAEMKDLEAGDGTNNTSTCHQMVLGTLSAMWNVDTLLLSVKYGVGIVSIEYYSPLPSAKVGSKKLHFF